MSLSHFIIQAKLFCEYPCLICAEIFVTWHCFSTYVHFCHANPWLVYFLNAGRERSLIIVKAFPLLSFLLSDFGFRAQPFQIPEHLAICQWVCNECHIQVNRWYGVLALRGNCSFILISSLWHSFVGSSSVAMS